MQRIIDITPGQQPPGYDDVELECRTTFPFTSVMENCPPDANGVIDPNRVAKFLKKRRQIRMAYMEGATPSQRHTMELREFQKYREYVEGGSINGGPGATDNAWHEQRKD